MKRNRYIWLFLWVLSIIAISFYGGPFSYGFFYAMTLIPFVSLGYLLYVYLFFHIYQNMENRYVVANEKVAFYFSLVNEYPILFSGIRVIFYTSFSGIKGLSDETEYELLPYTAIRKDTRLVCYYRGEYKVGIKRIEMQDFFRLFRISYKNKESVSVVVKPRLVRLENLNAVDVTAILDSLNAPASIPDIVSRPYIPGDEMRLINWSQSARNRELFTKKQIGEELKGIGILMDTFRCSDKDLEYIPVENKVLELTIALAYYLSRSRIDNTTYWYQNGLEKQKVGSEEAFENYYEKIARTSFDDRYTGQLFVNAVMENGEIFANAMLFIILTKWEENKEHLLAEISNHHIITVVYLVSGQREKVPDLGHLGGVKVKQITPDDNLLEVL